MDPAGSDQDPGQQANLGLEQDATGLPGDRWAGPGPGYGFQTWSWAFLDVRSCLELRPASSPQTRLWTFLITYTAQERGMLGKMDEHYMSKFYEVLLNILTYM